MTLPSFYHFLQLALSQKSAWSHNSTSAKYYPTLFSRQQSATSHTMRLTENLLSSRQPPHRRHPQPSVPERHLLSGCSVYFADTLRYMSPPCPSCSVGVRPWLFSGHRLASDASLTPHRLASPAVTRFRILALRIERLVASCSAMSPRVSVLQQAVICRVHEAASIGSQS